MVTKAGDLRDVSMYEYAWKGSHGVTDPNAKRELMTLGALMDHMNARRLPQMMDCAAQRWLSIQYSAANAGKNDQARLRELLPTDGSQLQPACMALLK